jgi:16S rRNA processing protein RimM
MEVPTVVVGRITRAHGVLGEVAVLVISEVPERFRDGATVWTENGRALRVSGSRSHGDRLLVRFEGVGDRERADALRGTLLVVPESASPELPQGSWWDHQIIGCAVDTDTGRPLGTVRDVIHTAANDVWSVLDADETETLIPVIADVIVEVDVAAGRIVVREVPGLTTPG